MSAFATSDLTSAFTLANTSPDQMRRRKIVKKGFSLCLMVCGRSGTGKSTFINTLCNGQVFPEHRIKPTIEMQLHDKAVQLEEEDGTTIHLTVVDTPGFGDAIDNNHCCEEIVQYLETQYDAILEEERRIKRNPRFKDNRVHAALYFISPTGHGLRELDIDLMKTLSTRVNVIPVIAKADTLTQQELALNKRVIMHDISHFQIPIYLFPCQKIDDFETKEECDHLRSLIPFSIVGSNEFVQVELSGSSEWGRARVYPWGVVRVEDPTQSDFGVLRSVLFGSHLQELRDLTHEVLYEQYRTEKLSLGNADGDCIGPTHKRDINESEPNSATIAAESTATMPIIPSTKSMPGVTQSLYHEQQKLQQIENQYQSEINKTRQELAQREAQLREITAKLTLTNRRGAIPIQSPGIC